MPIRAVIFDLWGTLILDDGEREGHARRDLRVRMTQDALAPLGRTYAAKAIDAAYGTADHEHGMIHAEGRDLSAEGRTILYLRHLDPDLAEVLDDAAWSRMHAAILTPALHVRPTVVPEAADVLARMKALGLPIGLVSNAGTTPGFVLRQILEGFGLFASFDSAIFSDEVELAKPTAAIFERSLEELDIEPHEGVFVGDQPVLDVLGPRAAGLWTVQVGALREDGIEPHARIATLDKLEGAIRSLGLL